MVGREKTDSEGFTTVNVRMPKSHWLGMIGMGLMALGGVGGAVVNHQAIQAQDQPVSREWARNLSDDIAEINKRLEIVARHDERISELRTQLTRIESRIDAISRRN